MDTSLEDRISGFLTFLGPVFLGEFRLLRSCQSESFS